jgi:hypothetical protein
VSTKSSQHQAGTIGVTRLSDYSKDYQDHAESKAADALGNPANEQTIGLLYRLAVQSAPVTRIGKEVDRLGEDDGAGLEPDYPVEYERNDLRECIDYLAQFSQAKIAKAIGVSERAWRSILKGTSRSRTATAERIRRFASHWRARASNVQGDKEAT